MLREVTRKETIQELSGDVEKIYRVEREKIIVLLIDIIANARNC